MGRQCLSRTTISVWLLHVIIIALESASDENCAMLRLKIYEVCSTIPSLLFRKDFIQYYSEVFSMPSPLLLSNLKLLHVRQYTCSTGLVIETQSIM